MELYKRISLKKERVSSELTVSDNSLREIFHLKLAPTVPETLKHSQPIKLHNFGHSHALL